VPQGGAAAAAAVELADLVAAGTPPTRARRTPGLPTGPLTVASAAAVVGARSPMARSSSTSQHVRVGLPAATAGRPPRLAHLTGADRLAGCPRDGRRRPDQPVGACSRRQAMRDDLRAVSHAQGLDVTTVVYNNSAYAILRAE
jgi:acetolactate synthase-1/2/3 large subunit